MMAFVNERTESSNLLSINTTDRFNYISVISKLKRLNDININRIDKDKEKEKTKTYMSKNSNSDVIVYKLPKNNSKPERVEKVDNNSKSHITKIIREMKHTLSKFKKKMHRLELENLKNEIANRYDAKNIVSIVGHTINKLKEELTNQEQLLRMFYYRQSIQPKSKKLPFYKYSTLDHNRNNKNNSQSQSKISQGKRSLYHATQINNANCIRNDHVSIDRWSEKNYQISNSSFENNYTSTKDKLEINEKVALWQKQNRAFILREITESGNWKHRVTKTKTKTKKKKNKESLGKKLTSKKVRLSDSDVKSTCSTVPWYLMTNRKIDNHIRICENKNNLVDKLKSSSSHTRLLGTHNVDKPEPTDSHSCYSEKTIIIPRNAKHETSIETDLEVESVNSSISSTFSAYIVPSIWYNTNDGNSSEINPAIIENNGGIVDKKMLMTCKVVLEKL